MGIAKLFYFIAGMLNELEIRIKGTMAFSYGNKTIILIELSTNALQDQTLNYIHQNPVEVGLVTEGSLWEME